MRKHTSPGYSLIFRSLVLLTFAVSCANPQWRKEKLAPGLVWRHTHTTQLFKSPQNIHALQVDLDKRQLELAFVTDTFLPTSQFGKENKALAAVNAGFFKIKEGRGSATYLRVNGQTIDNLPTQDHPQLRGALILKGGSNARVEYAQPNTVYNESPADETILVTGPVLLLNGALQPLDTTSSFVTHRHPRTCVCTLDRNRILLVTADGRNDEALGLSLFELAKLLQMLHCRNAINLDGGGSTTMWIKDKPENGVVNCPSDNGKFDHFGERPCANALIVH